MRTSAKLGLTALLAAMLLSAALSTATARNFEVSNQQIRVTWSRLEFTGSPVTVRCQVTLEGSFHSRTIAKTTELVGAVTRIDVKTESCTGGRAVPDKPPPWHITYEGFTGTLPSITSVRLLLSRFQFEIIATVLGVTVTCKYGTATDNITGSAALTGAGEVTELRPVEGRNEANLLEGSGFCPGRGRLTSAVGDGRVFLLGTTNGIRVTLI